MTPPRTSVEAILARLEAWGSASERRVNAAHGAGANQFGVRLGDLRRLAETLTSHHDLALKLWATGNTDAMILATMLLSPDRLSIRTVERMVKPITYYRLIDEFTTHTISRARFADFLRERWMGSPKEMLGRAGWNLLIMRLVRGPAAGLDFNAILTTIEAEMLAAPLRKQEAMNHCLVEIGARLPPLTRLCITIGERLGRFDRRPIPKGGTSTYAPEWIAAVLKGKT